MRAAPSVIASGQGTVVRWHCEHSRGGLVYDDDLELAQCLLLVAEAPELARELAGNGRRYVLDHYPWSEVLDRMEDSLGELVGAGTGSAGPTPP